MITSMFIIVALFALNIYSSSKNEDLEHIITNLENKDRETKQIIRSMDRSIEQYRQNYYEQSEKILGLTKYFALAYAKEVGYTIIEPSSAGHLFSEPQIVIWGITVHGEVHSYYMHALEFAENYHKFKLFKTEEEALANVKQNDKHNKPT